MALLIALEGVDGAGKSTQGAILAKSLGALFTREPGDSPLGVHIRELLLHSELNIDPKAEALLMAADRAQHVAQVIRPALQEGRHVISDRYFGSSVAYQGAARGLGSGVRVLSMWATSELLPDLTLLFDLDLETALSRISSQGKPDRLEGQGSKFLSDVIQSYREQATTEENWVVIDASASIDRVTQQVQKAVQECLNSHN